MNVNIEKLCEEKLVTGGWSGFNLKKALESSIKIAGVKQKDLTEATGISTQTIWSIKQGGDVNMATIRTLCKFFDIKASEFFRRGGG